MIAKIMKEPNLRKFKEGEVEKPPTPVSKSDIKQVVTIKCNSVFSKSRKTVFLYVPIIRLLNTVKPCLVATLIMGSSRYYGHFFWPPGKTIIHFLVKKTLVNMVTR